MSYLCKSVFIRRSMYSRFWVSPNNTSTCCNVNVAWPLIVVTIGPTECRPECLCVCLERLLLGAYQPSLSLASDSLPVVRPRGLSPESGVCDQTYGASKQLAESEVTNANHGTLTKRAPHHTALPWVAGLAGHMSLALPHYIIRLQNTLLINNTLL